MRLSLYLISLAVAITSFALTLSSLLLPTWIIFQTPHSSPISLTTTYGLFKRCDWSSFSGDEVTCRRFPMRNRDCDATSGRDLSGFEKEWIEIEQARKRMRKEKDGDESGWGFCDSFLTAGYLQQLSLIFISTTIVSIFLTVLSGRVRRETGWKLVALLLFLHALCVGGTIGFVSQEYRFDDRFYFGSRFGPAFIMAATSAGLDLLAAVGMVSVGVFGLAGLRREDDYERIED